ncbi:MAG: undecaprenyl-diphosphatase UppP, partial [bacterium]|nr:undecaprenyl-diphosphatase UppP [bacterium]
MNVIEAILLGIVQGLTEFIPVSSSGHLLLVQQLLGLENNSLAFDVALHGGTLLALLAIFWRDLVKLAKGFFTKTPETHIARLIAVATIPAAVVGYFLQDAAESTFRSSKLVAVNLILVAIFMLVVEYLVKRKKQMKNIDKITWKEGIAVGVAQAVAILPGTSRSAMTITTGLLTGVDRVSATRFSFLLGIPITFGAILKVFTDDATMDLDISLVIIGIITAFASGILAINFLLKYLKNHSLHIFAYYRIAL